MKKLLTLILTFALSVTALLSFTACGNKKDPNKIYVGMECGYAPFNFTQMTEGDGAVKIDNAQGYANGYDVMIAKKIAEETGKELVILQYEFDGLINAVNTGALDFIIAGMSPTAKRLESIDFSDAYYESQLVIVVRKDGAYANAANLDDFNGAKIAAQIGTFHNDALQAQAAAHGIVPQTPMETFPALINALNTKAIDGYVAEEPGAIADCAANADLTYVHLVNNSTGFTATAEDVQIAIGMKKGSEFKATVNAALQKLDSATRLQMMTLATEYATKYNQD